MHYSKEFITAITSRYGDKGKQWLEQLPTTIAACAQMWGLTDIESLPEQTYNYVLFAKRQWQDVALKLRIDIPLFALEVAYLRHYQGPECVRLLNYDTSLGALLLERIMPGTPLTLLVEANHDNKATTIAMHLLQKIQQSSYPSNFPDLDSIVPTFERQFPALDRFAKKAAALRQKLLANTRKKVLLHGDFHHGNILADANGTWRVIDPEGLIGDRAYDAAVFIRNPLATLVAHPQATTFIKQRMQLCAQLLGEEYQHIFDWTYLQTVTSAYWSAEDGLPTSNHVQFLTILEKIS